MIEQSSPWTRKYSERVLSLEVTVGVSVPFVAQESDEMLVKKFTMIWDTGASGSVITPKIVNELGLKPIDRKTVYTASGSGPKNVFLVNLLLPNNTTIPMVRVTESDLTSPGLDGLLGMDVIGHGDFSVTHADGETVVSFRMPSCAEIDYVKEKKDHLASKSTSLQTPKS